MPHYNPEQEFLSRGMSAVLKLALLYTVALPWACPLYCLNAPSTPILISTVFRPYFEQFFGSLATSIKLVFLGFDLIFILMINYMAFSIILYFVSLAIIYMGKVTTLYMNFDCTIYFQVQQFIQINSASFNNLQVHWYV